MDVVPGNIQLVGETGQFYTIVTLDNVPDNSPEPVILNLDTSIQNDTSEGDILVCGKCKTQFPQVQQFLDHKNSACCDQKRKRSVEEHGTSAKKIKSKDDPVIETQDDQDQSVIKVILEPEQCGLADQCGACCE